MCEHNCCSFFGHSKITITNELKNKLYTILENLIINENITHYCFGGLGEFDELCWQIVTDLKNKYTHIKRIYFTQSTRPPKWLKENEYEQIINLDLDYDFWYTRIYFRNCEIVNRSNIVIFYVNHTEQSGAFKMLKYAIRKKKRYINLCQLTI